MNLQDDQITPYPVIQTTTYITQYVGLWLNIDRCETQYAKAFYSNTIFKTSTSLYSSVRKERLLFSLLNKYEPDKSGLKL